MVPGVVDFASGVDDLIAVVGDSALGGVKLAESVFTLGVSADSGQLLGALSDSSQQVVAEGISEPPCCFCLSERICGVVHLRLRGYGCGCGICECDGCGDDTAKADGGTG